MDNIQRRLAEIDRQFDRNPAYYYKQSVSTAPLVFCAIGLIAGIIIQDHLPTPIGVWSSLLIICAVILIALPVIFILWPVIRTKNLIILPFLTVVLFICLGAIRLASFNNASPNDIRNLVGSEAIPAAVRGVIVTEPYIDGNDWKFSKFTFTDRGSSFYLELTEAEATTGWINTSGLVRVRVNEPIFDLRAGDRIQMYCLLNKFNPPTNPGEFDIAKYMARNGVFVAGSADSRQAIEILSSDATGAVYQNKIEDCESLLLMRFWAGRIRRTNPKVYCSPLSWDTGPISTKKLITPFAKRVCCILFVFRG